MSHFPLLNLVRFYC